MDIYDDSENILSSEDDSEEDLITTAIRANKQVLKPQQEFKNDIKINMQDMKSRHKRRKHASRAIKRSVNWLNSKTRREKYKQILNKYLKERNLQESLSIYKYSSIEKNKKEAFTVKEELSHCKTKDLGCSTHKSLNIFEDKWKKILSANESHCCQNSSLIRKIKRSRSVSPTLLKQGVEDTYLDTSVTTDTMLFKEVNKLFPKYNKVLEDFVKSSTCSIKSIELKISNILVEIQTLSDIIETKEFEWNKLLHLRKVKEEIIMHLVRKKNILELKQNNKIKTKPCSPQESDLNICGNSGNPYIHRNFSSSTAHSLIEKRANMGKEDLEKEKTNINRLHSILVSENILPNSGCTDQNVSNILMKTTYHSTAFDSHKNVPISSKNLMWQHNLFHDVKRLISDFKQNTPKYEKKKIFDEVHHNMSHSSKDRVIKKSARSVTDTRNDLNDNEAPLCQACKSHQSRFVCAGCSNQWYCSRRCQVSAWDKHSDICNE